jgi:hypothetical protein
MFYAPFALAVVALQSAVRRPFAMAAFIIPTALTAFVTVIFGRASHTQIKAFEHNASLDLRNSKEFQEYLRFMGSSAGDAFEGVVHFGPWRQLATILLGVLLVAVTYCWVRFLGGANLIAETRSLPIPYQATVFGVLLIAIIAAASTGVDWMRWVCMFGGGWTVSSATLLVGRRSPDDVFQRSECPSSRSRCRTVSRFACTIADPNRTAVGRHILDYLLVSSVNRLFEVRRTKSS